MWQNQTNIKHKWTQKIIDFTQNSKREMFFWGDGSYPRTKVPDIHTSKNYFWLWILAEVEQLLCWLNCAISAIETMSLKISKRFCHRRLKNVLFTVTNTSLYGYVTCHLSEGSFVRNVVVQYLLQLYIR